MKLYLKDPRTNFQIIDVIKIIFKCSGSCIEYLDWIKKFKKAIIQKAFNMQ